MCFILYVVEKMLVFAPYIKEDMSNLKGIKMKCLFINHKMNQPIHTYTLLLCFLSNNING